MLTPLLRIKSIGGNWDHVMSLIVEGISSMKEEDHGTMSVTEGEVSL